MNKETRNRLTTVLLIILTAEMLALIFAPLKLTEYTIKTETPIKFNSTETICNSRDATYTIHTNPIINDCIENSCIETTQVCERHNSQGDCTSIYSTCKKTACTKYNTICSVSLFNNETTPMTINYAKNKFDSTSYTLRLEPKKTEKLTWSYYSGVASTDCGITPLEKPLITTCINTTVEKTTTINITQTRYKRVSLMDYETRN